MKNDFKIKLVFAPTFDNMRMGMPSLGMSTLTAYLRGKGFYVDQVDLLAKIRRINEESYGFPKNLKFDLNLLNRKFHYFNYMNGKNEEIITELADDIINLTEFEGYDLIGFSVHSMFQFLFAVLLAKRLRSKIGTPIVFGGTYITLGGYLFFDKFDFIDYMIIGDGEIPMIELLEFLQGSKHKLTKVASRENNNFIATSLPINDVLPPDLNGLDLNDYKYLINGEKKIILPYQTVKGCSNHCSFCTHHIFSDGVQLKSADKILKEVKKLSEDYDSEYFYFCDSAGNVNYDSIAELCRKIASNRLNIKWGGLARLDNIDKSLAHLLYKSGCRFLRYGIETGSQHINSSMGKNFTISQAEQSLRNAHNVGIINIATFVSGAPHESKRDVLDTVEFLKNNKSFIQDATVGNFCINHSSPIQKEPEKYGITNLKFRFGEFFSNKKILKDFILAREFRKAYSFDEINGLKWMQKKNQQRVSRRMVKKAIQENICNNFERSYYFTYSRYFNVCGLRNIRLKTILIQPQLYNTAPVFSLTLGIPILQGFLKSQGYKNVEAIDFNHIYNTKIIRRNTFLSKLNLDSCNLKLSRERRINTSSNQLCPNWSLNHSLNMVLEDNFLCKKEWEKIYSYVKSFMQKKNPDVIGISVSYPEQIFSSLLLSKIVKEMKKEVFVVLGGAQITKHIKYLVQREKLTKIVDGFIVGDGEEPLAKLIFQLNGNKNLKEVPNFYSKKFDSKDKPFYSKTNFSYTYNPRNIIVPDFSSFQVKDRLPIRASVGCPWGKCTYCTYRNFHKRSIYSKPEDVVALINNLIEKYKVNHFWFFDDALNVEFLRKFSRKILEEGIEITWSHNMYFQPELLDESFVKTLAKAGCKYIGFGLESISPRILKLMNRPQKDPGMIRRILKLLKKHNIRVKLFLVSGFPSETKEEAEMTLDFLINEKELYFQASPHHFTLEDDVPILKNPHMFGISRIYQEDKKHSEQLGFYYKTCKGMTIEEAEKFVNYLKGVLKQEGKLSQMVINIERGKLTFPEECK